MKWLPLKADFTGIEEETPCPHERSLQSWVLIDLSVPAIWGVNWASLLLFRDVYAMFMARSVDVEKVSFSCALHLGPLCFYQRFMSKSGFTVKLTSEPLVARSPSKSLQRALKMCHMVMWFCKIGKNKLVLWVIFKELCPPQIVKASHPTKPGSVSGSVFAGWDLLKPFRKGKRKTPLLGDMSNSGIWEEIFPKA